MVKRRDKKYTGSDRRRWTRIDPSELPFLNSVAFHKGSEVQVINISQGGMLLETEVRLQPKMKILLKINTSSGVFDIEGSVLRSSIASLQGSPRYRSAISFQHPIHMVLDNINNKRKKPSRKPTPEPESPPAIPQIPGQDQQDFQTLPGIEANEKPTILTVMTQDSPDVSLNETFILNDW